MKSWRAWLGFVTGIVVLQCCVSLQFPYSFGVLLGDMCRLSPDLVFLLGLATFGAASGRPWLWAHLAALLLVLAMVFHATIDCLAIFMPHHVFELTHVGELAKLVHLLFHNEPPWYEAAVLSGVGIGLLLLHAILAWSFAVVVRPARRSRGAYVCAGVLEALAIFGFAWTSCVPHGSVWAVSWLSQLGDNAVRTAHILMDREGFERQMRRDIADAAERLAAEPGDLTRLEGADVHIVFLESYGRMALDHDAVGPHFRSLWAALDRDLLAAGFQGRSSVCYPAISGGASWLAHAQLFAGLHVPDNDTWELLIPSALVPLPRRFAETGYHTVEVMPAMHEHWPEGQRFYGFTESVTQLEMPYDGPTYHWGRSPDQFALHHLLERIVKPATKPLLTCFVSCTSHAPFSPIPHYVEDWHVDGDTWKQPPQTDYKLSFFELPNNPVALRAYRDAIEYSLRTMVGFICRLPRPSLVIALGDHQPPIAASTSRPDRRKDVPIHVFANRPGLLEPFRAAGFVEGFDVPAGMVAFDTADFAAMLLRMYAK